MEKGKDYIGVGCGALIVNDNKETLLLKRTAKSNNEAGFWSKPGGSVEYGETVREAICREIKEELDVDIELDRFLGFTDHLIKSEGQHWIAISYLAKIISGEPKNTEPDKCSEVKWFSLDRLPENITQTTLESVEIYNELKKGVPNVYESK